jgi:hypothetical protein
MTIGAVLRSFRWLAVLAGVSVCAAAQAAPSRVSGGRFGDVTVAWPSGELRGFVVLFSAEKGWSAADEQAAPTLAVMRPTLRPIRTPAISSSETRRRSAISSSGSCNPFAISRLSSPARDKVRRSSSMYWPRHPPTRSLVPCRSMLRGHWTGVSIPALPIRRSAVQAYCRGSSN